MCVRVRVASAGFGGSPERAGRQGLEGDLDRWQTTGGARAWDFVHSDAGLPVLDLAGRWEGGDGWALDAGRFYGERRVEGEDRGRKGDGAGATGDVCADPDCRRQGVGLGNRLEARATRVWESSPRRALVL